MLDPDYELFTCVVANGSLAAAARSRSMSPAMVSKRLTRMEQRIGTRLMHRTTRRLVLTEAGETFHHDLVAILAEVEKAEAKLLGERAEASGPLRMSAPTSFGRLHLAPYVKSFLDAYPKVDLRIELSDDFTDLLGERIDLAIRIAPSIDPALDATRLATSRRIVCAAPSYIEERGEPATTDDLRGHRLLAADAQLPWRLDGPGGAATVEGRSFVRTNSSEMVRELALAGVGVALRSLWDVHEELSEGRLKRVLADFEGSSDVGIYAVQPGRTLVPSAVRAMRTFLAALYAFPAPWER